jgi:hypothetical protein
VTTREDQPQLVVFHDLDLIGLVVCHQYLGLRLALVSFRLSAQPVDSSVTGGGDDPTGRAGRKAGGRPSDDCLDERLLDRVFGDVDVTETADQGGDGATGLFPEDLLDLLLADR